MSKYCSLLSLLLLLMLFSCGNNKVGGIVDETDTEITATLVDTAGNKLPNVPVRVYNHKATTYFDSIQTDINGNFTINTEQLDTFTIWAETDTSGFFRGNIVLEKTKGGYSSTDTLTPFRKIYVPIKLQPQHQNDYNMLEAHILGTHIATHMGAKFHPGPLMELERIPIGTYNAKIDVDDELSIGYATAYEFIDITPFTHDTLSDTIEIPYHGIHVVTGIHASYDTLSAKATISWDKTKYIDIDSYIIYRKKEGEPNSLQAVGATADTTFIDTTLSEDIPEGTYEYRVVILDKDLKREGPFYFDSSIDFKHPKKIFNIVSQAKDTLYLNMEATIPLHIDDWFGDEVTSAYKIGEATEFTLLETKDELTFKVTDGTHDSLQCIVSVSGRDTTIYDTLVLTVISRWNKQANSFYSAGKVQKPVLFNETYFTSVINGDKQSIYTSTNGIEWSNISDSAVVSYDSSWASNIAVADNKLWILDGNSLFFSSTDGTTWTQESTTPIESPWSLANHEVRVLESKGIYLEILFENSGVLMQDNNYKTAEYTYFTYTPGEEGVKNTLLDNDKSVNSEASWINFSQEKGFQIFVYEGRNNSQNPKRAIKLFEITSERFEFITSSALGNDTTSYPEWSKSPLLPCINYNEGLFFHKGFDKETDLLYPNSSDWQANTVVEFKLSPGIPELSEEPNTTLFETEQGLVLLSPKGVYTDFQ